MICRANRHPKFFPLAEARHRLVLARIKLKPLASAWNSQTKVKGALNNVMNPNIYLSAIVSYRLAQRDQKQKVVPEPEFRRVDLTYLTGAPAKRNQSQDTAGTEKLLSTMQNSYADKIVLVTGIGKATAIAFPDACAKVVLTGLEPGSIR